MTIGFCIICIVTNSRLIIATNFYYFLELFPVVSCHVCSFAALLNIEGGIGTIAKNTLCYGNRKRHFCFDRCQIITTEERPGTNGGHTTGYGDVGQTATISESTVSNGSHAVAQDDAGQASATLKSLVFYICHIVGDCDGG